MKKRRVWRYTCEFCKKSNCSSSAMRRHEVMCFRNPSRHCVVCERQWPVDLLAEPIAAMAKITTETETKMLADLRDAVESCPACVCAAIAQAPLPMVSWDTPGEYCGGSWYEGASGEFRYRVNYSYKPEMASYRHDKHAGLEPMC